MSSETPHSEDDSFPEGDVAPEDNHFSVDDIASDLGIDPSEVSKALDSAINPLDEIEVSSLPSSTGSAGSDGKKGRGRPRSLEQRQAVTIYLRPDDARAIKLLAVEQGKKIYELYDEGIELVLRQHKKRDS